MLISGPILIGVDSLGAEALGTWSSACEAVSIKGAHRTSAAAPPAARRERKFTGLNM